MIADNPNDGVLGFEYPNPFPPTTRSRRRTIFFQLAGNRISSNLFVHNGYDPAYSGSAFAGDVTLTERLRRTVRRTAITLDEQLRQRQRAHRRDLPAENRGRPGAARTRPPRTRDSAASAGANCPNRSNTCSRDETESRPEVPGRTSRLRRHSRRCRTRARGCPRTRCAREPLARGHNPGRHDCRRRPLRRGRRRSKPVRRRGTRRAHESARRAPRSRGSGRSSGAAGESRTTAPGPPRAARERDRLPHVGCLDRACGRHTRVAGGARAGAGRWTARR